MASHVPIMPFLRPLTLPRPSTVRHFLRLSTSAKNAAETSNRTQPREDPNLIASRTASPTYPPTNMPSKPRPKVSRASRRTSHPPRQRQYPTRQFPIPISQPHTLTQTTPIKFLPESESAPNLPYFVRRTRGNELPVYTDYKRGGNLHLTIVRKVDGDLEALRGELRGLLVREVGLDPGRVMVNGLARQVVVKGLVKGVVEKFLRERRF